MKNYFLIAVLPAVSIISSLNAEEQLALLTDESALFEEISFVYSASKHDQPVTNAPASVSIVSADEIKKYGYRTLAEVLSSMKGMYTSYDRVYHRLGIRGFNRPGDYNYRILILVDGHRINDNLVDYNAIGTEFIVDIDDIKRVELVRGPSSSLYGSNAFFGVINVITKQGRDMQTAGITGEAGSYRSYKGKVSYGDKFANGAELYTSISYQNSGGKSHVEIPGLGIASEKDGEDSERAFVKFSYQDLTISGGFVQRGKDLSNPIIGTIIDDERNVFVDERAYADILYERSFDNDIALLARVYYDYYRFDGDYAFEPKVLYQDDFNGHWWGTELQLSKQIGDHLITVGGEYRDNFHQEMRSFQGPPLTVFGDTQQESWTYGLFLQDEYKIFDNLIINAGFRYDDYSHVGDTINPRAALIYQPWDTTTLKFIYAQAFRAPSAFEQNYTFSDTWIQSSGLQPENIYTYELEWIQKINQNMTTSVSPYFFEVKDIIQLTGEGLPDNPNIYQNQTDMDIYGVEVELTGQWVGGWRTRFSYAYQYAKEKHNPRKPLNSPAHLTKFNLIAPLWREKVFGAIELQYTSRRNSTLGSVPGYLMANATLFSQNLLPGLELSASLYNLLDRTYHDPSTTDLSSDTIQQNGRQFRFKFNYEF